jgi:hypothetical protein
MKLKPPEPAKLYCPDPACKQPFQPLGQGHLESCQLNRQYVLPQLIITGHKVRVFGSRKIPISRHGEAIATLDQLLATNPDLVILHGGAKGSDSLAGEWADDRGVAKEVWRAQRKLFPPWLAGLWRNAEMAARAPQEGVALVGPCEKDIHRKRSPHASHGSVDMALRLKEVGIPVIPHTWGIPAAFGRMLAGKELQ